MHFSYAIICKKNKIIGGLLILISGLLIYQVFNIKKSVQTMLAETRARLLEKNRVPHERKLLTPHPSTQIRFKMSAAKRVGSFANNKNGN